MNEGLAAESNAAPDDIARYYDEWAQDDYDGDVESWGYEAPELVAAMVADHLGGADDEVLDAGCGTGRVGAALQRAGVRRIVGGDFTPASLDAARRRSVYTSVEHLDLNGSLGYADQRFAAAVSVGVFSYVHDTGAALAELARVVRPGGVVIFTQRTDLWRERSCDAVIDALVQRGVCTVAASSTVPYLPGHPDFGTDIDIVVTTLSIPTVS